MRGTIFPGCPGSSPVLLNVLRRNRGGILVRCLNPLKVRASELQLYSEALSNDWILHPMSNGEASHPPKKPHFHHLFLLLHSFGHCPKLMTIGNDKDADWPVNWQLHFCAGHTILCQLKITASHLEVLLIPAASHSVVNCSNWKPLPDKLNRTTFSTKKEMRFWRNTVKVERK